MIYQELSFSDVLAKFRAAGRLQTPETSGNFTPDAVHALFNYYEELAQDIGEPIELDVIAWCCDWSELSAVELVEEYGDDGSDDEDEALTAAVINARDAAGHVLEVPQWGEASTYLVSN